jgi:hypothetical protein
MRYNLDRFKRKGTEAQADGELTDAVTDAAKLSTSASSLGRIIEKLEKKEKANAEAKKSVAALSIKAREIGDEEPDVDIMGKLLGKMLKFVGKRVLKALVRPVLEFAGRVAMGILRIAARAAIRFIIWPAIELVGAAIGAVVSAVGLPVLIGALAIGGLAYGGKKLYDWWKSKPEVVEIEATAPTGAVVGEATPEVTQPAPEVPKSKFEQVVETVRQSAPVQAVERAFERPKIFVEKSQGTFRGFGEDMDGYIRETAARYPILPEDELRGFIRMESGWTGAMSPTGAIGTGQFTAGTWNRLITRGGAQIGMTPITGIYSEETDAKGKKIRPHIQPNPKGNFRTPEDPRFNRRVNTLATGLLAAGNAEILKRNGIPITGANLYMMHNIGPGIIAVMKGQPASDATLLAMRQNGMIGKINTPEKFLAFQKGRYEQAYQQANSDTRVAGDQPQMTKGIAVDKAKPATKPAAKVAVASAALAGNQQTDLVKGPGGTIVRIR